MGEILLLSSVLLLLAVVYYVNNNKKNSKRIDNSNNISSHPMNEILQDKNSFSTLNANLNSNYFNLKNSFITPNNSFLQNKNIFKENNNNNSLNMINPSNNHVNLNLFQNNSNAIYNYNNNNDKHNNNFDSNNYITPNRDNFLQKIQNGNLNEFTTALSKPENHEDFSPLNSKNNNNINNNFLKLGRKHSDDSIINNNQNYNENVFTLSKSVNLIIDLKKKFFSLKYFNKEFYKYLLIKFLSKLSSLINGDCSNKNENKSNDSISPNSGANKYILNDNQGFNQYNLSRNLEKNTLNEDIKRNLYETDPNFRSVSYQENFHSDMLQRKLINNMIPVNNDSRNLLSNFIYNNQNPLNIREQIFQENEHNFNIKKRRVNYPIKRFNDPDKKIYNISDNNTLKEIKTHSLNQYVNTSNELNSRQYFKNQYITLENQKFNDNHLPQSCFISNFEKNYINEFNRPNRKHYILRSKYQNSSEILQEKKFEQIDKKNNNIYINLLEENSIIYNNSIVIANEIKQNLIEKSSKELSMNKLQKENFEPVNEFASYNANIIEIHQEMDLNKYHSPILKKNDFKMNLDENFYNHKNSNLKINLTKKINFDCEDLPKYINTQGNLLINEFDANIIKLRSNSHNVINKKEIIQIENQYDNQENFIIEKFQSSNSKMNIHRLKEAQSDKIVNLEDSARTIVMNTNAIEIGKEKNKNHFILSQAKICETPSNNNINFSNNLKIISSSLKSKEFKSGVFAQNGKSTILDKEKYETSKNNKITHVNQEIALAESTVKSLDFRHIIVSTSNQADLSELIPSTIKKNDGINQKSPFLSPPNKSYLVKNNENQINFNNPKNTIEKIQKENKNNNNIDILGIDDKSEGNVEYIKKNENSSKNKKEAFNYRKRSNKKMTFAPNDIQEFDEFGLNQNKEEKQISLIPEETESIVSKINSTNTPVLKK